MPTKYLSLKKVEVVAFLFSWFLCVGACGPSHLPVRQDPPLSESSFSSGRTPEKPNARGAASPQQPSPSSPSASPSSILGSGSQDSGDLKPEPETADDILAPPSSSGARTVQSISAMESPRPSSALPVNWWDDVVLSATGVSIVGSQAKTQLRGDLVNSQIIRLKLIGNFNLSPEFSSDCSRFTREFGLLHQMFIGNSPKCRVVMDNSILWDVVSVSTDTILIQLDTKGLGEFYLTGLHQLALETPSRREKKSILVGTPVTTADLRPVISQVSLLKDAAQKPAYLKIQGAQLMVNPALVRITVDGVLGFPAFMQVLSDDTWETLVPVQETFDPEQEHTVQYTTPFGFTFAVYEGEGI